MSQGQAQTVSDDTNAENDSQLNASNGDGPEGRATSHDEQALGRSTAMMSALVIVSRLTGFVRTWAQAYALGVTVLASCYAVANNLPTQLYEIVVGGLLVTAFLPVYLSIKKKAGQEGANRYVSNLVSIVFVLMGVVTILGIVFAFQVVWTQSFSATEEFDFNLTVYFFRFFAIEVLLYALSSIVSGILNAERDYFWSTAAPIFNNFITTASFLLYAVLVDSSPKLALLILALGNPLGVLVQVLVQMPSLRRRCIRVRPLIDLADPALKETISIGLPSLAVMLCSFITVSVMTSSALSVTPAGASVSAYARLWFTLPYAIFAVPITTAMFTELSDDVAHGNMKAFRAGIGEGTSKVVFLMVPFMLYLIVFARPLVTLLASGKFSQQDVAITSSYLQALSVSLPFYAVSTYLQKVCSANRSMGLFTVAHIVAAVIQTAACLALTSTIGLNLVALSSTLYMIAVDVVTFVGLSRKLGSGLGLRRVTSTFVRSLVLGLAGAAVGYGVCRVLGGDAVSSVRGALLQIFAGGIPSVIVTFGLAMAFKVPETAVLQSLLAKIRR